MKILIDSNTLKKISEQLSNHSKVLKHQPLCVELYINNGDVEMIINSEEARLRLDYSLQIVKPKN